LDTVHHHRPIGPPSKVRPKPTSRKRTERDDFAPGVELLSERDDKTGIGRAVLIRQPITLRFDVEFYAIESVFFDFAHDLLHESRPIAGECLLRAIPREARSRDIRVGIVDTKKHLKVFLLRQGDETSDVGLTPSMGIQNCSASRLSDRATVRPPPRSVCRASTESLIPYAGTQDMALFAWTTSLHHNVPIRQARTIQFAKMDIRRIGRANLPLSRLFTADSLRLAGGTKGPLPLRNLALAGDLYSPTPSAHSGFPS
jgi:hypothetical protein